MKCIDMNPDPAITDLARCITARQDGGIGHHKGEKSAALFLEKPIPVLTPMKEKVRQQGRRFKNPDDPMFTITVTDRNGVVYNGLIRKLMPLECWRLQGFTDEQFEKAKAAGISNAQLYKQAGNAVTVNVMSAAVNSRQALETMGMYYEDISIRINDTAGHGHIEDYEKIVEKYSHIEKKYYVTGLYLSLNGESVMCEVWDEIKYLPGLLKGRLPIYENEVMITGSVADTLDLKMGDRVTMAGKKQEAEYIVSGIYQTGNDAGYCTAMSLEAAKRIGIKNVSNLGMVLTDTSELEKIAEELNSEYGNMITASANRFEKDITNDTLMTSARAIRLMIYAFSGVFALVAVIMVCSKAFSQERTDLGIYKAMGFTSGRLRRQFAVRFLIISLIGSVVGAAAGALFSVDILNLVFSLFGISRVQSDSTPLTFIMAAAFVCLSTAVFAYLTSRRIKKIEVRELVTE